MNYSITDELIEIFEGEDIVSEVLTLEQWMGCLAAYALFKSTARRSFNIKEMAIVIKSLMPMLPAGTDITRKTDFIEFVDIIHNNTLN